MELPKINQKVELKLLSGPFAAAYSTYIDDVETSEISVARPLVGGEPVALAVGDLVRLEYAIAGAARIAFVTRVAGLEHRGVPVVLLAMPEKTQVERFQQRDFVRLEATLNLMYYVSHTPDGTPRPTGLIQSRTRDISGNGAQILCPEAYPMGTRLDIHLEVEGRTVHIVGEVIRAVQAAQREYWMGVRFVGLEERDRDTIIRYIFNEQRERRRRGLI